MKVQIFQILLAVLFISCGRDESEKKEIGVINREIKVIIEYDSSKMAKNKIINFEIMGNFEDGDYYRFYLNNSLYAENYDLEGAEGDTLMGVVGWVNLRKDKEINSFELEFSNNNILIPLDDINKYDYCSILFNLRKKSLNLYFTNTNIDWIDSLGRLVPIDSNYYFEKGEYMKDTIISTDGKDLN